MQNDVRDLPASNDGLYRFLGGSPLSVAFRLILLSILVGVVLAAIGFDPWNIILSIRQLFQRLWDLGFDAVSWLWRYFLLGAVIVIPIWLLSRLFGSPARAIGLRGGGPPMQVRFIGCCDAGLFGSPPAGTAGALPRFPALAGRGVAGEGLRPQTPTAR